MNFMEQYLTEEEYRAIPDEKKRNIFYPGGNQVLNSDGTYWVEVVFVKNKEERLKRLAAIAISEFVYRHADNPQVKELI